MCWIMDVMLKNLLGNPEKGKVASFATPDWTTLIKYKMDYYYDLFCIDNAGASFLERTFVMLRYEQVFKKGNEPETKSNLHKLLKSEGDLVAQVLKWTQYINSNYQNSSIEI